MHVATGQSRSSNFANLKSNIKSKVNGMRGHRFKVRYKAQAASKSHCSCAGCSQLRLGTAHALHGDDRPSLLHSSSCILEDLQGSEQAAQAPRSWMLQRSMFLSTGSDSDQGKHLRPVPRFCLLHGADVEGSQDIPVITPNSPCNQHRSLGVSRKAPFSCTSSELCALAPHGLLRLQSERLARHCLAEKLSVTGSTASKVLVAKDVNR